MLCPRPRLRFASEPAFCFESDRRVPAALAPSGECSKWGYANAGEGSASSHNLFQAAEVVFEGLEGIQMKQFSTA